MAILFYIITKVNILEAFNFQRFATSVEIAKINCNFLVLQYRSFQTEPNASVKGYHYYRGEVTDLTSAHIHIFIPTIAGDASL